VTPARPFLKWAGGKRQLLPQLRAHYPSSFGSYIEPFLGSAAVFFDLHNRGQLQGHDVLLADTSAELIDCFIVVRDALEGLTGELERLQAGHRDRGESHYYEVRDERYNAMRRAVGARDQAPGPVQPESRVALAAMFIYLNRTGYNGLYRVNSKGDFNVPMGRYVRPRICDAANLRAVSAALAGPGVRLERMTFVESLALASGGDFVYLDPPYAPLTRTANFTAYTTTVFRAAEQQELQQTVIALARRGVQVLLSNSAADEVRSLYAEDALSRGSGLQTHLVPARRAINSRGSRRGPVYEYVITNVRC
jgi:DNA adenine methylase